MAETSVIGRGTQIRGRISGQVDLEIQGFVDGEVAVDGDVTIDAHGMVGASVNGRRLVVRGAVKGDLTGEDAIVLEDGARVVGDVRAPRVAIAPGALVRGYVQTGDMQGAPAPRARAAATPSRVQASAPRPAPKAAPAPPPPARVAAKAPVPSALAGGRAPETQANHAPPKREGPPPPVVPSLKKGAKGQMKKRA